MVKIKKQPPATTCPTLADVASYRQALGCLQELGMATDSLETRSQCERILHEVVNLGVVLAKCDLMSRYPITSELEE